MRPRRPQATPGDNDQERRRSEVDGQVGEQVLDTAAGTKSL